MGIFREVISLLYIISCRAGLSGPLLFFLGGRFVGVRVECMNFNYQHSRPSYFTQRDLDVAYVVSRHIILMSSQIKALGLPVRRLGHMVKYGFLFRYCLTFRDGTYWNAYAIGHTARRLLGLPVVGISNPSKVHSMLLVNQVLVHFLSKVSDVSIEVNFHHPVQAVVTVNNPLGVCAPRRGFDRTYLSRHNILQAIVVLPERSMISSGLPVRYCFDDEMDDPFNLVFYQCLSGMRLEPVDLFGSSTADDVASS